MDLELKFLVMERIMAFIVSIIVAGCMSRVTTQLPIPSKNLVQIDTFLIPFHPLQSEKDLEVLIKEVGNAKIVLLGESTHGTHEFYEWRIAITKKLIKEKGFDFISIEGDWVDSRRVNQFISGPLQDSAAIINTLKQFDRWPEFLWANREMVQLVQWLYHYNQKNTDKVGFYGLDLYSFWEWTENSQQPALSTEALAKEGVGRRQTLTFDSLLENARVSLKNLFAPFNNDALKYAASLKEGKADGRLVTENYLKAVRQFLSNEFPQNEIEFNLLTQALLAVAGEKYFRTSTKDFILALNIRDAYMATTLARLLKYYGKESKGIVWAHNGHVGNSHYSDPGNNGYTSMGEILKMEWGDKKVFSIGMGTYKGFVTAGHSWNAPVEIHKVLPAKKGSWESILHEIHAENKLVLSKEIRDDNSLNKWIEFRSIGAAYAGAAIYNYSIMPKRFDAFLFFDSTSATLPLR